MEEVSKIKQYYSEKCVLITGATGFVGKVLLLKLLISCPNIDVIYVLLRCKNETPSSKRLSSLLHSPPFSFVLNEEDVLKKKVVAIDGDILKEELALSQSDRQLIKDNVSLVFHCAASVKFDAPLKESIEHNLLGTKNVVDICQQIKNLSCFVHCSTAYSHCNREEIDEKFYDIPADPQELLKLSQWLSAESLDQLAPYLMNGRPNTYTYTKALAEKYVFEQCTRFPVAVVRPAIVINSESEPIPGWIDNLNGPSGISILGALGILRCIDWNYYAIADFVPVDKVVNALIAIGWTVGHQKKEKPTIYNVTSSNVNPISWGKLFDEGYKSAMEAPSIRLVRPLIKPPKQTKAHPFINPIKRLISHWFFAYLLDFIILICGQRRIMVRITQKMHYALEVMSYFTKNQWKFKSNNLINLWDNLNDSDKKDFNFDMKAIDWTVLASIVHYGNRRYLLKESDDNIPLARKRMQRITIAYWAFKIVMIALMAYLAISFTPISALFGLIGKMFCNFSTFMCLHSDDPQCLAKP